MPLILRFLLVGGISTLFSYGVYAFCVFCGLNYALAGLLALLSGILFSFKTQGRFVFRNGDNSLIFRFVLCWGLIYAANILFLRVAINGGMDKYVAGVAALPVVAVLSFIVQRYLVFGPSGPPRQGSAAVSPRPPREERG